MKLLRHMSARSISRQLILLTSVLIVGILMLIFFYTTAFTNLTAKRANVFFNMYARQVSRRIEAVLSDIEGYMSTLSYSKNIQGFASAETAHDRYLNTNTAIDNLDAMIESFPLLRDIHLLRRDGINVSTSHNYHITEIREILKQIIEEYRLKESTIKAAFYTRVYDMGGVKCFGYVIPVFSSRSGNQSSENIGVIVAVCDVGRFVNMTNDVPYDQSAVFSLEMSGYRVYSTGDTEENKRAAEMLGKIMDGDERTISFRHGGTDYIGGSFLIHNTNWQLQYWCGVDSLTSDMQQMRRISLIILICLALFLLIDGISLYLNITRPISEIAIGLKGMQHTGEHLPMLKSSKNELQGIVLSINSMMDRLEDITRENERIAEKMHNAELAASQAKLAYYQKQIEPHFLFNSMECIRSMAASGRVDIIEQFSRSLARLLRYSTEAYTEVTLELEVGCMYDYFNVMSIRFPERYELRVSIPQELMNVRIQKMTLQPLLENSLLHAYDASHTHIQVAVQAFRVGEQLRIRVSDNGRGIEAEQVEEIRKRLSAVPSIQSDGTVHLGLLNVHRRIALKYGDAYGVTLRSASGFYTSVEVSFPG